MGIHNPDISGGGGSVAWGDVTGDIVNQTDLQTVLNAKATIGGDTKAIKVTVGTNDEQPFSIKTNNTDRVTILPNGNVGIGTISPQTELEVVGDVTSVGTKWRVSQTSFSNSLKSVCYGNGMFVAIGSSLSDDRVITSYDGINWTSRSVVNNSWTSVCYGNGLFVAVAFSGTGNRVTTSPDGINWTSRTSAADNFWNAVCYGNGLFVAVAFSGTGNRVMTSSDGVTWTLRTNSVDNNWVSVCYGNGLFVAVSDTGTGNRIMTSPDGITWTSRTSTADNNWASVCYGNGLFVAVASSGTGNRVMTSPDGINWTSRTSSVDNDWKSVCYGNGLFVAVANLGTSYRVMTSPDGITWTSRLNAMDNLWVSVCYGNGLFVAVASLNSTNRVMVSGKQKTHINYVGHVINGELIIQGYLGIGTTTPVTKLDVAGDARIGGATNSTQFAADGSITLAGTARKTTNLWIPATSFHSQGGVSGATLVAAGLSFALEYSASHEDIASISLPLPLDMDLTMPMQILIGKSNSGTTGNERWQAKYLYVGLDESAVNTTPDETLQQTVAVSATANGLSNVIFQTVVPASTDKMLHMQISRLGGDVLDTATGDSLVYGAMILYTTNKLGV